MMFDLPKYRSALTALTATAVLLAVAAAVLSGAAASPASGDTGADSASAREARAAGSPADSGSVPRPVREWAAAWNEGSPESMGELFTEDGVYEDHAFQAAFGGRDGVAQWISITNWAIDDTHVEVHDAFRSGDRIAVEWTFSGKNTAGGVAGQPPTGKSFSVPVVSTFDMKGDKIERVDDYYNLADLLRQVDLPSGPWVPPPA